MSIRLGLDIGGTFTDLVLDDGSGRVRTSKVPTTHHDLIQGLLDGLSVLAGEDGRTANALLANLDLIVHGTTVATNAVLTETGARTGLITTHGFRDILAMRRGLREAFYDNKYTAPTPLVPRYLRRTVRERVAASGAILMPLSVADVREACEVFRREAVEAVAIAFMHSYKEPAHEVEAAAIVRDELPGVFITASHEILPAVRLYDRASTTVFNAYTGPIVHRYLSQLESQLRSRGFRGSLLIMQSNGGVTSTAEAARAPARLILSGPAGGPAAGISAGAALGYKDLVVCDAGGTSFEASLVENAQPLLLRAQDVDRRRIALPALGIHTLGAGGGSIAWVDGGGLLHVGPQSAGSQPGPACYGRGGTLPTATDAALVLGYLDREYFLDGRMPLDSDAAHAAIETIAGRLDLDVVGAARGIVDIIAANMAAGIQAVTVQRGFDPREFLMIAGGGAGPLFACRIAEELQLPALMVPAMSATLCAWGALNADLAHDDMVPLSGRLDGLAPRDWRKAAGELWQKASTRLSNEGVPLEQQRFSLAADLRYVGQYDDITMPVLDTEWAFEAADIRALLSRFHATHDTLNGYSSPNQSCEVTALHMTSRGIGDRPRLTNLQRRRSSAIRPRTRRIVLEAGPLEVPVHLVEALAPGEVVRGPAIIELPGSTLLLRPAFWAGADRAGNLLAFRSERREIADLLTR